MNYVEDTVLSEKFKSTYYSWLRENMCTFDRLERYNQMKAVVIVMRLYIILLLKGFSDIVICIICMFDMH